MRPIVELQGIVKTFPGVVANARIDLAIGPGEVLALLGESAVFQSPALLLYAGVAWLCCHLFVVLYEEPALRRRFGAAYDDYRGQVPRWLPRLR